MARTLYPAFLDLSGRQVLVVGGGGVAAAKVERLLDARADVVVVAPEVRAEIAALPVRIHRRRFAPDDLAGKWWVVSAAPPDVNAAVVREGTARGVFVNAVDDPPHASAFAGSVLHRGPVTVAISTAGEAPALARVLREALERLVGRNVEDWAALAAAMRPEWRRQQVPMEDRRDRLLAALAHLHAEAVAGSPAQERRGRGFVSIVGAGPGDPDLLTRKAARRLAEADLVLYDALVPSAMVSLATRAQQILVGRRRGFETMPQEAVNRTLIRAAGRGKRVVRLKGGDPFVFGRGGEEVLALQAAGVDVEVVPGVSSAFAAPAAAGIPVTHRGVSAAVLVTTGHDVERFARVAGALEPRGATLVVMMATAHRAEIAEALAAAGWPSSTPAAIVRDATRPEQTVWTGRLAGLAAAPDAAAPGTIVIGDVVALAAHVESRPQTALEVCHA